MTGDYVSLYTNSLFSKNDPMVMLSLMFLFLGRMLPIIALSPFFGAKILPRPVKVTLALSLFAIFIPQLISSTTNPVQFDFWLVLYFLKELFVGTLMGFMISIPFSIVQNAGLMIDHQRGGSSLMVNDPTVQNQSSPLGLLFNYLLIYLFFRIDGPFIIIDLISQSYTILPPDQFLSREFFYSDTSFMYEAMKVTGQVMIISTQLAAPALIMILMTDFFLGIANRLAPQVQVTFLGMPLKSLLGLTIIFFGWQLLMEQFVAESYTWLRYLRHLITLFAPIPEV